jgi:hypothetical protein
VSAKLPDGERSGVRHRARWRRRRWASSSSRPRPALRQPLRVLLHRGAAEGAAQAALHSRRRLPLSFAYGNFATLSNVKEKDIQRILEYRLSPLYVSVHATPWEARKVLLNNPRVPNIVEQLTRLAEGGIQFHGQMVIVPGLNDGDVLEESLPTSGIFGDAVCRWRSCRWGSRSSRTCTPASPWIANAGGCSTTWSAGHSGRSPSAASAGCTAPTSSTCWRDASCLRRELLRRLLADRERRGRGASLRDRVARRADRLPRLDGKRIGVVTGSAMAPLMPELLEQLTAPPAPRSN